MKKIPKIEKGIPIPPRGKSGRIQNLLSQMEAGDSVLVDRISDTSAWREAAKHQSIFIITRKEGSKYRIWHGGANKKDLPQKTQEKIPFEVIRHKKALKKART